ncbi:ATP-binding protein [Candidatus Palauibacter sp.]|uniref:hybrid sensor histidine kinase/response regulator n=1 Tax=Candidatus Palauibacter sp. TaxID=3101350 RepID=UPI003B5B7E57
MSDPVPAGPGNGASGDRTSRLSAAILRISASLDLATVLEEVVDSARALTGARAGVITTIDGRGRVEDFVTSGLSPEERRKMDEWPDGERLFRHLRDLPAPLRVADVDDYLRSLGLSPNPWGSKTMQGTPMRRGGGHLGSFFLADKEDGGAFTDADEEVLVLFASQAATAIANARTHRDVERARTDLAALIETSPVGVAVFDAATGHPVSFNREARRIVEALRTPGRPPEQLLEVITCTHPDGREVSLEELPLSRQLGHAETMRAEEVELSVPDGRSVRTLLNVTPIRSPDGGVVSVVVTMQDLEPLEELERQRAEFLGMVSHELRAPLTSIKGSAATVLDAATLPSQAEMMQFFRIIGGQADHMRGLIADLLDAGSIEAGTLTVQPESSDLAALVDRARNTFLSGGGRHAVMIDLPPDLPRAMADRQRIVQVLNNLLSNAARHAPPSSPIGLEAAREDGHIAISVSDEGRGIPPDRLPHLFRKRASTAGGTGLGLAICNGLVEAHGGRIRAESGGTGQGARFSFTIPVAGEAAPGAAPPSAPSGRAGRQGDKGRVLVVDDDPHTLRYVRDILSDAGYAPVATGEPGEVARIIRAEKPRLVLLDLILPGTDGIELMKHIPALADLPVIFISGYGRDETIAKALASGAADYIVKPFSHTELLARVQAALRAHARPETFACGELAVDFGRRRVTVAGREVRLSATEFELLRVLSAGGGRVVTTEALLRKVWGRRGSGDTDRVRTALKKLRKKLGDDAADPVYIFNAHGVGYRFAAGRGPPLR